MNKELKQYIEEEILSRYDHFDETHRRDHAEKVIRDSLKLAKGYEQLMEDGQTIRGMVEEKVDKYANT